jgi:mono/diheme cytochrome c family protein/ABC-type amino acid transport substrate-binding protein
MIAKFARTLCALLVLFGAPVFADDAATFKKAESTFKTFCAHCHGLKMVSPGTSSFDLRKWPKDDKAGFVNSVTNGKGDMPAWGDILLPEEMDLLWHYVKTRAGKEPAPFADSVTAPDPVDEAEEQAKALLTTPGTLTACLAKNGGVMSARRATGGAGLDYELAAALAAALDVPLDVRWFESEQEEESTPIRETYALLAYQVCDIIPGFALYENSLSAFYKTRAALPRWDDKPEHLGMEFQVDLEPISFTDPYARMEMGVVYRTPEFERDIQKIADMEGLRIGVEQGTLAGVLTLRQGTSRMVAEGTTLNPGPDFLWHMEQGEFDAALVTVGAYDFHKKQNFISTLVLDEYRHPLGFNLSVAMLGSKKALRDVFDPVIAHMIEDGTMAMLGRKSGHTYAKPREPWVQPHLTMQTILTNR